MNRLSHLAQRLSSAMNAPAPAATRSHKGLFAATAATVALFGAAPAMASVINFDTFAPDIYSSGDLLQTSGYKLLFLADPTSALNGWSSGVGAILDGRAASSCDIAACPSGAGGNYLAILNDGGVKLSHTLGFTLAGFDYSFIAPVAGGFDQNWGQLQLSGTLRDGTILTTSLAFPGQGSDGNYHFQNALLQNGFGKQIFTGLTFNACIYDVNGICSNSVDSPAFNQAQFALNNINVSAVPEPSTAMLMLAGLGAIGMLSRRRAVAKNRVQGA